MSAPKPGTSPAPEPTWPVRDRFPKDHRQGNGASLRVMLAVGVFLVVGMSGIWLFYRYPQAIGIFYPGVQQVVADAATTVSSGSVGHSPLNTAVPSNPSTPTPLPATVVPGLTPSPTPSPTVSEQLAATPTARQPFAWLTSDLRPLPEGKWIEIDLGQQRLVAYEGTRAVFTSTISTGPSVNAALAGRYRIMGKKQSTILTGPGYYLPDVPWVLVLTPDILMHGAYWLDDWGIPSNHGSINLPPDEARWLFTWAEPAIPSGLESVTASVEKPGTWVLVHP